MKPQTISEQMQYSTLRLEAENGSTGTGFFMHFITGDKAVPIIVSNKHVINNNKNEKVKFYLHVRRNDEPSDEKIEINFKTDWHFHPTQDLCYCFAGPLLNQIKAEKEKDIFYIPITEELIWDDTKLQELSAVEDVLMVGYPNGLWDQKNNLPLFRRGVTSSHPAIDFNDKNIGAVDMACFPGSSGSPIFILNENGYSDKQGNMFFGAKRIIFLGVLFQGPQIGARGELIVENIPTQQKVSAVVPMMINLGYYIKSVEILEFKKEMEKIIERRS